eukprot:scaffold434_cov186-Pinguiococcus_pyrenoidosus.AAC.151
MVRRPMAVRAMVATPRPSKRPAAQWIPHHSLCRHDHDAQKLRSGGHKRICRVQERKEVALAKHVASRESVERPALEGQAGTVAQQMHHCVHRRDIRHLVDALQLLKRAAVRQLATELDYEQHVCRGLRRDCAKQPHSLEGRLCQREDGQLRREHDDLRSRSAPHEERKAQVEPTHHQKDHACQERKQREVRPGLQDPVPRRAEVVQHAHHGGPRNGVRLDVVYQGPHQVVGR